VPLLADPLLVMQRLRLWLPRPAVQSGVKSGPRRVQPLTCACHAVPQVAIKPKEWERAVYFNDDLPYHVMD
jgi:hypothetical protein